MKKVCNNCKKEHEVSKIVKDGIPWYLEENDLTGWLWHCDCRSTLFIKNDKQVAAHFGYVPSVIIAFLAMILISCGSSSDGDSSSNDTKKINTDPTLQSIALESADDLPECEKANAKQLAYVIDSDQFFVCEKGEWTDIDIKGKDGQTIEVDNIPYHKWVDPFTGLTWVFAGTGDYESFSYSAVGTCATSGFRMPTQAEGVAARAHGIRQVATELGHQEDFWVQSNTSGAALPYRINLNGLQQVVATTTNSIFCVKI